MSRSAIVGLVVGIGMLVALGLVEHHYWAGFSTRSGVVMGLVLTMAIYGALLAAVCIRRIVDPWLPTPILAWILMWIWWVFDFITDLMRPPADVIIVEEVVIYDDDGVAHDDGMGYGWAIFMTLIGIGMYAGGIALTRYLGKHPVHHAPSHSIKIHKEHKEHAPEPHSVMPSKPTKEHKSEPSKPAPKPANMDEAKDLAGAIAVALPEMTPDAGSHSQGTIQLSRWVGKKLHWSDVANSNETSIALAEKDVAKAFGKKLCESGTLERIEKQNLWGVELHNARLVTKNGDTLEMLVAGNTGTLVKRNQTKFCGVVTGRLEKSGKTATLAVGMFETAK